MRKEEERAEFLTWAPSEPENGCTTKMHVCAESSPIPKDSFDQLQKFPILVSLFLQLHCISNSSHFSDGLSLKLVGKVQHI